MIPALRFSSIHCVNSFSNSGNFGEQSRAAHRPFNNEDAEVVAEEGELYYVVQDEMSTAELNESDYRCIFWK